jgi:hypothetical protein
LVDLAKQEERRPEQSVEVTSPRTRIRTAPTGPSTPSANREIAFPSRSGFAFKAHRRSTHTSRLFERILSAL